MYQVATFSSILTHGAKRCVLTQGSRQNHCFLPNSIIDKNRRGLQRTLYVKCGNLNLIFFSSFLYFFLQFIFSCNETPLLCARLTNEVCLYFKSYSVTFQVLLFFNLHKNPLTWATWFTSTSNAWALQCW